VEVQVDRTNSEKYVIKVKVPKTKVEEEISALATKRQPNIALPGFRRGMVPLDILKKQLGDQLRNEVSLFFVNTCTEEAIRKEGLHNSGFPELLDTSKQEKAKKWLGNFGLDGSFSFEFALEPPPQLDIQGLEDISYEVDEHEVEHWVEGKIKDNQMTFSKRQVIDTPAALGNEVVADMEAFLGGNPVNDGKTENATFILGRLEYFRELEENFVGKVVGDHFDTTVVFPTDHPTPLFAGKSMTFKCHLKEVRLIDLHPANDDLAQMLSHENLQALKDFYQLQAEEEFKDHLRHKRFHALRTKLVAKFDFKIPSGWLLNEQKLVCSRLGMTPEKVKVDEKAWKTVEETAELNVRTSFLLDKIFESRADLQVEEPDVLALTVKAAQKYRITPDEYLNELRRIGQYESFIQQVQQEKTVDWLLANTKKIKVPHEQHEDTHS
jgi:trigger factor